MLKITKQSITLTKGDDASIQLIPRYKDKTAYVFLEGDRGVFRLKTGNTLIEKECDIYQDPNKMVVSFQPADTINLKPGIYRYEVELITIYGFHYTFIADQTFIIGNEYEQRLQASGSNGSGNAGSNLPEIDGELTEDPVVSGEIQPTNPSVDYNNLTNKPKLNGVQIAGNHDNAYYGIPTELADLTADADHRTVSDTEKETWNAKSDFSGSYNDLTDVPEDLVEDAEYVHTDNNYTSAEKTKLGDIEPGAEVNVQADWNETDTSSDAYIQNKPTIPAAQVNSDWNASSGVAEILHKPTLGTAAAKDYTGSVLENSTDLVESGAVKTAIDNAISSVYKPAGNKACAELVSALLIAANLGNVYNMTDDGVTTADFVEGAGKAIEAGDNVVIVDIGSSVYKFDLLSGMVDLSNYVQKSSTAGLIKNDGTIDQTVYAKQNEMSVNTSGDQTTIQLKNGTSATVINAHQDISGKANKSEMTVTPGTGSDADKTTIQLKSGTDATVLTQHQDISGKVDKEQGKGLSTNDYTTVDMEKLAAISTEANKVTASETNGNIQIDGTETTIYDDTELQGAVSDLEDDVEEIQGELTTELATVEGNPLNFSTKSAQSAKSTILSCEPIQDFHGYDKPWAGGAGKNIFPQKYKSRTLNGVTFTYNDDGTFYAVGTATQLVQYETISPDFSLKAGTYIFNGVVGGGDSTIRLNLYERGSGGNILLVRATNGDATFTLDHDVDNAFAYFYIASGLQVDMVVKPMLRLALFTDPTFEPYENICPISGRTEIGILGCGKNLYIGSPSFDGYTNLSTWTKESTSYNGHDVYSKSASWGGMYHQLYLKAGTYVYSCMVKGENNAKAYMFMTTDGTQTELYSSTITNTWTKISGSFTLSEDTNDVILRTEKGTDGKIYISEYQLEKGNQPTTYSPYTKSTDLTISLGQTVYGGTLDVENGVLVVDWKKYNLGEATWVKHSTMSAFYSDSLTDFKYDKVVGTNNYGKGISDSYNFIQDRIFEDGNTMLYYDAYISANRLWVFDATKYNTMDATQFKTAMDGVYIAYMLDDAHKTEIQLTPHTINLLKGVNNISTDGDKITLTYRDGSVATLGDLTSAVDNLDSKIDESKILTDTATGDKYILVVTNGVLDIQQISN